MGTPKLASAVAPPLWGGVRLS